jgi:hypothetical protein
MNENHLDFFNLGKIVIIFCTLANLIYQEGNEDLLSQLEEVLKNSKKYIDVYNRREQLASE